MAKVLEKLYYLSVFLILLPSISLQPFFSTVHNVGGYISLFLFLILIIKLYGNKAKLNIDNKMLILFLIFFLSQSLSILSANNISSFFNAYRTLVFSGIFFILSAYFINNLSDVEKIVKIIFLVTLVNISFQFFILLYPNVLISFGQIFLNKDYLSSINIDVSRGRISIASYDEILMPIMLFYWIKNRNRKFLLPFFIFIPIFSFLSGFRTKVLMLFFALMSSFLIFIKNTRNYFIFFLIIPVIFYFLYNAQEYNVIDRLLLQNQVDVSTITSRMDRWGEALDMGLSSPIIGVGLGNYYDYLPPSSQKSYSKNSYVKEEFNAGAIDPHDIFFSTFAETGAFGISTFVLLLCYFAVKDLEILRRKKYDLTKAFIISFWTLFMFSVFNPSVSITYLSLFWLLRVMVYKSSNLPRL